MRENCFGYLVKEIEILEPTLVITQGAWAVGKPSLVDLFGDPFGVPEALKKNERNRRYGLYEYPGFMLITSLHPGYLHFWKSIYAPDTLWPMIDCLKARGYLPRITSEDAQIFEQFVRPAVDKVLTERASIASSQQKDELLALGSA
ncbi:MAG: hypothetical protein M5R40_27020 [Anaerolineae bacterium]|nr:hypothetical protein [Anaerolineae bacterium]